MEKKQNKRRKGLRDNMLIVVPQTECQVQTTMRAEDIPNQH
jgi:hypothetical protein